VADTYRVPFFDRDGEHWITLDLACGEDGPPEIVELAGQGPTAGRGMRCQFRREYREQPECPWVYVETSRTWNGAPEAGSTEALRRLCNSRPWVPPT
jgi:hypothetical protein